MIDVAVVGAGPAGLLSAALLAEAGLDVLVFEEHARVGEPTHCTGIISLEVADFAKIPDDIVLQRLRRARMIGPRGATCELPWHGTGREEILVIDRAAFDRSLAEQAMTAGAAVVTGVRVDSVRTGAHSVQIRAGGAEVSSRTCVLACGVSYCFARQLGLGLPSVIHTAQLEVDALPAEVVELHFGRDVAPEGFIWAVPVLRDGRSRVKVGIMAQGDAGRYLRGFLDRPAVRERLTSTPDRPMTRVLPLKPLPRTYADRVVAVGDAGGFTKPTTGGGIFYSLLTATLAAETLVAAFQTGRFNGEFLSRYERRWQERLGPELRISETLRRLLTKCTDEEIDKLLGVASEAEVKGIMRRTVSFNWHRNVIVALAKRSDIMPILTQCMFR